MTLPKYLRREALSVKNTTEEGTTDSQRNVLIPLRAPTFKARSETSTRRIITQGPIIKEGTLVMTTTL